LLTNSEMDSVMPFAGILVGQPQLRRRLRLGSFAALDQRIALRYELAGMTAAETDDYLTTPLRLAGREDRLFSDDAIELLHERSRGIPRALNNLATPSARRDQHRPEIDRRHHRRTRRRHRGLRQVAAGQHPPSASVKPDPPPGFTLPRHPHAQRRQHRHLE